MTVPARGRRPRSKGGPRRPDPRSVIAGCASFGPRQPSSADVVVITWRRRGSTRRRVGSVASTKGRAASCSAHGSPPRKRPASGSRRRPVSRSWPRTTSRPRRTRPRRRCESSPSPGVRRSRSPCRSRSRSAWCSRWSSSPSRASSVRTPTEAAATSSPRTTTAFSPGSSQPPRSSSTTS